MARAERAAQELDGATFTPGITRLAAALCAGDEAGGAQQQPAWVRLAAPRKPTRAQERLAELRAAQEQQQLEECTFRPRVDKHSAQLMAGRSAQLKLSAYDTLYADAVRRHEKMESLKVRKEGPLAACALFGLGKAHLCDRWPNNARRRGSLTTPPSCPPSTRARRPRRR